MSLTIDPKQDRRIRDGQLMKTMHLVWKECCVCGETSPRNLHHVNKHPRDDVRENLVMLCGSGTTGCHGRIEARDPVTMRLLGEHIDEFRGDITDRLFKIKGREAALNWMRENLLIGS